MKTIHRMNSNGLPRCGAAGGKVSMTGLMVTCQHCLELQKPMDKEAIFKQLMEAAERFNAKHA